MEGTNNEWLNLRFLNVSFLADSVFFSPYKRYRQSYNICLFKCKKWTISSASVINKTESAFPAFHWNIVKPKHLR